MMTLERLNNLVIGDEWEGEHGWAIGHLTEDEAVEIIALARKGLAADSLIKKITPLANEFVFHPNKPRELAKAIAEYLKELNHD